MQLHSLKAAHEFYKHTHMKKRLLDADNYHKSRYIRYADKHRVHNYWNCHSGNDMRVGPWLYLSSGLRMFLHVT